jgi:hypothetical protein
MMIQKRATGKQLIRSWLGRRRPPTLSSGLLYDTIEGTFVRVPTGSRKQRLDHCAGGGSGMLLIPGQADCTPAV